MFRRDTRLNRLRNIFTISFLLLLVVFSYFNFESYNSVSSFSVDVEGPIDADVIKASGPVHFIITVDDYIDEVEYDGKQDVIFLYEIKSSSNEVIFQKTDTKAVLIGINTSTSYKETFFISGSVKEGFYTLNAKITSLDGVIDCESNTVFEVVRVGDFSRDLIIILLGAGFFITCVGFFYEHRKVTKMKVSGRDLEKYIGKK